MKSADLLHSLSPREKKELEAVIKKKGRSTLTALYQTLRKTPRHQLKNERVFEVVFSEPYDKKKDYLLRNELRLLGNELRLFIAAEEVKRSFADSSAREGYWYLKSLWRRGDKALFAAEFDKIYEKAATELNFHLCVELSRMKVNQLQEDILQSQDFVGIEEQINKMAADANTLATALINATDYSRAFINRLMAVVPTKQRPKSLEGFEFTEQLKLERKDPYSNLLYCISRSYLANGEQRIEHLNEALTYLDACKQPDIDHARLSAAVYNTLSISYMEMASYELATDFAQKAFVEVFPNGYNPGVLLANYLRCLTLLGDIAKARDVFNQYGPFFKDIAMYPVVLSAVAEMEIVIGDPHRGQEILTQMQTKGTINYGTYKMLLMCAYCRAGEYALAMAELNNQLQKFKAPEHESLANEIKIRLAMKEWLKIVQLPDRSKAKPEKLQKATANIAPETRKFYNRSPVIVWFLKQIDDLLKELS